MLHRPVAGVKKRSEAPSKPSKPRPTGRKSSIFPMPPRIGRHVPFASKRSPVFELVRRDVKRSLMICQEPKRKSKPSAPAGFCELVMFSSCGEIGHRAWPHDTGKWTVKKGPIGDQLLGPVRAKSRGHSRTIVP